MSVFALGEWKRERRSSYHEHSSSLQLDLGVFTEGTDNACTYPVTGRYGYRLHSDEGKWRI